MSREQTMAEKVFGSQPQMPAISISEQKVDAVSTDVMLQESTHPHCNNMCTHAPHSTHAPRTTFHAHTTFSTAHHTQTIMHTVYQKHAMPYRG